MASHRTPRRGRPTPSPIPIATATPGADVPAATSSRGDGSGGHKVSGVDSSGKAASRSASGQGKPRRRRPPGGTKFTGAQLSPYRAPVPGMSKRASRRRAQRSGQSSRSSSSSSPFPYQHPDVGEPAPRRDVAADAGIWDEGTGAGAADLADSSRVPTLPTLPLQASSNAVASHGNSLSARSAARPSGGAGGGASWTRTPPVPLTTRPGSVGSGVAASAMPLQESPYARSPRPPQAGATSDPPSPRARRRTRSTDEREAAPPAAAANGSLMGGVVGMERCSDSVDSAVRMHVADFNTAFANFVASGGKDPPPLAAARQALNATMVVDAAAVDQSHAAASRDFAATAPMRGSGNTGNGGGGGGGRDDRHQRRYVWLSTCSRSDTVPPIRSPVRRCREGNSPTRPSCFHRLRW